MPGLRGGKMGKQMTFFLFIGMFQGLVDQTRAFRKEEDAEIAFHEYTGYEWEKVNSDKKTWEELGYSNFGGSEIQELQIEP